MWSVVRDFDKKTILLLLRTLFSLRESAVDDTAEGFSEIAVGADSTVIIGVKFVCALGLSVLGSKYWGICQS
jgi:hypothetical protein